MTLGDAVHDAGVALVPYASVLASGTVSAGPTDDAAEAAGCPPNYAEFIGVPEWCDRIGCSRDSGYRAARRGDIPGLFRVGKLMRINWPAFMAATATPPAPATAATPALAPAAPAPTAIRAWQPPADPSSRARGRTRAT
jgi:hypothetical protein